MAYPKGKKRPEGAGRKKGTPNKSSLKAELIAEELGVDPFKILLLIAAGDYKALGFKNKFRVTSITQYGETREPTVPMAARAKAAADATKHLLPTLKALEHSGPGGENLVKSLTDVILHAANRNRNRNRSR